MRMLLILVILASMSGIGCKKKSTASPVADTGGGGGGGGNTNYEAGGGAIQNSRQAARRTVALNDMSQLGQLIELQYNENGKMPNPQQIKENLRQSPQILAHLNEGTIILTGTTDHAGLWAYEIDAEKRGGIVLQAGSARRATADEVGQLLGK